MRSTVCRPVHLADDSAERKSRLVVAAGQFLKLLEHAVLIEPAISQVGFDVGSQLQLPASLDGGRVDSRGSQSFKMIVTSPRVDDMNRLVAAFEPVLNERHQDAILFIS